MPNAVTYRGLIISFLLFLCSCWSDQQNIEDEPSGSTQSLVKTISVEKNSTPVCYTGEGKPSPTPDSGLFGRLKFTDKTTETFPVFFSTLELTPSDSPVKFKRAFTDQSLARRSFEFSLDGRVQLQANDLPGSYQVAVIYNQSFSARLSTDEGWETFGSNLGETMKMECSVRLWPMGYNTQFRIKVRQSKRSEIALTQVWLWRPVVFGGENPDELCGQSGVKLFFDSADEVPAMQVAYLDLLARGWKPLSADNFILPEGLDKNPCE